MSTFFMFLCDIWVCRRNPWSETSYFLPKKSCPCPQVQCLSRLHLLPHGQRALLRPLRMCHGLRSLHRRAKKKAELPAVQDKLFGASAEECIIEKHVPLSLDQLKINVGVECGCSH